MTEVLFEKDEIITPYKSLRGQAKVKIYEYIASRKIPVGSKLPSVRKISDDISISRATVGKAVAEMINDGFLISQPRKGVYLRNTSHTVSASRLETIYCLIGSDTVRGTTALEYLLGNPFWSNILVGVRSAAAALDNVRLRVSFVEDFLKEKDVTPRGRRWDNVGFIICGDHQQSLCQQILELNIPTVLVSGLTERNIPAVNVDTRLGTAMLVDHLVNMGHRRIAYCGLLAKNRSYSNYQKYLGYIDGLKKNKVNIDLEEYSYNCEYGFESGHSAMASILKQSGRPTAVIFVNDETAIGGIRAVCDAGLTVPKDISIAGFDNILAGEYTIPSLTTISSKMVKMGEIGLQKLCEIYERRHEEKKHEVYKFKPELIARESTGPVRK